MCPVLGTWPTIQACVLTGNWTGYPLVCRLALNALSHTSWGYRFHLSLHLGATVSSLLVHLHIVASVQFGLSWAEGALCPQHTGCRCEWGSSFLRVLPCLPASEETGWYVKGGCHGYHPSFALWSRESVLSWGFLLPWWQILAVPAIWSQTPVKFMSVLNVEEKVFRVVLN